MLKNKVNSEQLKEFLFKNVFNFFDKENENIRFSTNLNYETDYSILGKDIRFSNDNRRKITAEVKSFFCCKGEKHDFICAFSFLPMAEINQFTAHYIIFFTESSFRKSKIKDEMSHEIINKIKQNLEKTSFFKNVTNIKTQLINSFIYVFFDFDYIQENNKEIDIDYFYFIDNLELKKELKDINLEKHYPILYDRFKRIVLVPRDYKEYEGIVKIIYKNKNEDNSETLADIIELNLAI